MTIWPGARPNHAVDAFYLAPPLLGAAAAKVLARTVVSGMPLVVTEYRGDGVQTPITPALVAVVVLATDGQMLKLIGACTPSPRYSVTISGMPLTAVLASTLAAAAPGTGGAR